MLVGLSLAAAESGSSTTAIVVNVAILILVPVGLLVGLGFACRAILAGKGRSPAAGFCLGCFLGLIGLLIAVCLSDQRPPMPTYAAPPTRGQWAADPWGRHEVRYHNGAVWTEHVANGGRPGIDPMAPPAGPSDGEV